MNGVVSNGPRTEPAVALTFDDGPEPRWSTPILDVLERFGAPATFFVVGQRAEAHPEIVQRMERVGGEVGSHAYEERHLDLRRLRPPEILRSLTRTHDAIGRITGRFPVTFRPPFGFYNAQVLAATRRFGYQTVLWDVDAHDWQSLSARQILDRVLPNVRNGSIILMHAGTTLPEENLTGTIQALPVMIQEIRRRGLQLVTVEKLLGLR